MIAKTLRNDILQRLLNASDAKFSIEEVTDSTSLRDDLDISSLNLIALASDLEEELQINIADDELTRIQTVGDLFRAIENHKSPS